MTAQWQPNIDRRVKVALTYWIADDIPSVPRAISKSAGARSCRWEADSRTTKSTTEDAGDGEFVRPNDRSAALLAATRWWRLLPRLRERSRGRLTTSRKRRG
jgi:hypothetical protein